MSPRTAERRALAAMVGATLLWGGTFVAIRDSVAAVPPATLVAWRFAAAGVLFALVLLVRRRRPAQHDVAGGLLSGVLMVGGFYFQAIGLRTTAAGTSAFLTCAGTLLAAFWAWPLLRQRPGGRLIAGIALAMAGAALLSLRAGFALGVGELWTLAGAALFALQIVGVSRYAAGADPVALVCVQSFTAAAILMPFAGSPRAAAELFVGGDRLRFIYLAVAGSTLAPLLQVCRAAHAVGRPRRAAVRARAGVRTAVRAHARRRALRPALVGWCRAHPDGGGIGGVASGERCRCSVSGQTPATCSLVSPAATPATGP